MTPEDYLQLSARTESLPELILNPRLKQSIFNTLRDMARNADYLDQIKRHLYYKAEPPRFTDGFPHPEFGTTELADAEVQMLHAALGKVTEALEFAVPVINAILFGRDYDQLNALEEIGDGFWYDAITCRVHGISIEEIMEANIAKLLARYPEQFDHENAIIRDLDKEVGAMEEKLK